MFIKIRGSRESRRRSFSTHPLDFERRKNFRLSQLDLISLRQNNDFSELTLKEICGEM